MKNRPQARDAELIKRARLRVLARLFLYDLSVTEIARKTGWNRTRLYQLRRTPLFREVLEEETQALLEDTGTHHRVAHMFAAKGLIKTVRKLTKMLNSKDPAVVFGAADRIARLNRGHLDRIASMENGEENPLSQQNNIAVFSVSPEAREHARKFLELTRKKDGSYGPNGEND